MNEQIQPSKGAPLFNPWSSEFIANPYPSYHLLRETEPMHYMPLGLYVASRNADITAILRDKRFGKESVA
jgi:cytochrome P450